MRISDWSSDVCSSDLSGRSHVRRNRRRDRHDHKSGGPFRILHTKRRPRRHLLMLYGAAHPPGRPTELLRNSASAVQQGTKVPMSTSPAIRSVEHTSELQSLMRTSYAVFCLKKKNTTHTTLHISYHRITTQI